MSADSHITALERKRSLPVIMTENVTDIRIDKFTVRQRLGRGGMGAVYEGHDPALDRRVAIKTLTAVGPCEELFLLVEDGLGGERPLHGGFADRSAVTAE